MDYIWEFCFHKLSIIICDLIFKWIFKALKALTLVTTSFKSSTQDWNTLLVKDQGYYMQAIYNYRQYAQQERIYLHMKISSGIC